MIVLLSNTRNLDCTGDRSSLLVCKAMVGSVGSREESTLNLHVEHLKTQDSNFAWTTTCRSSLLKDLVESIIDFLTTEVGPEGVFDVQLGPPFIRLILGFNEYVRLISLCATWRQHLLEREYLVGTKLILSIRVCNVLQSLIVIAGDVQVVAPFSEPPGWASGGWASPTSDSNRGTLSCTYLSS